MPKYRFVTGRYNSQGERIKFGTVKTSGKLSTNKTLRYGAAGKPKKAKAAPKVKKTDQFTTRNVQKGEVVKQRKVLTFKGSVKTFAQLTLGKQVKAGKYQGTLDFYGKGDTFKQSVIALAEQNRAPEWMISKLNRMDGNKLYLLGQLNRHTVEVYFDYGSETDASVDEYDLFWSEKWDDIEFLIEQYERAFGVID